MDADDDNMLLNLTTNVVKDSDLLVKSRLKRKNVKVKAEKPQVIKKKKLSADESDKNKGEQNEHSGKFQIVSTLFRKNPDIPQIPDNLLETQGKCCKKDTTFTSGEFRNLNLAPFMISNLEENLGIKNTTSVQQASLPLLLKGKDMFIKSPTGTGKTLTYAIPVVQSLQAISPKIQRSDGPYCVVLVPTRELAVQSLTVMKQIVKPFIWIVPGCVTGGEKRKAEKARLRRGVNVLVATPGRLVDHLKTTQCLNMSKLKWLILDEADRLLDLGFEQDLSFILSTIKNQTCEKVQTVLLSATLSQDLKRLAKISLNKPVSVNISRENDAKSGVTAAVRDQNDEAGYEIPNQLRQFCVVVPMKLRLVTLAAFLKQNYKENSKMIVFFTTQDSVDFHYQLFSSTLTTQNGESMSFMRLHGKLSQQERTKIFMDFKDSDIGILFCTDVASRGLDLPSVSWIIQYNPPASVADYVHRVGRTARIGSTGQALLFLLPSEVDFLNILCQHKLRLHERKMNNILSVLLSGQSNKSSKFLDQQDLHAATTSQHMVFEEILNDPKSKDLKKQARAAFNSFVGAYNTFPSCMKAIFHSKKLHLGHLAKSFALRETPGEMNNKILKR